MDILYCATADGVWSEWRDEIPGTQWSTSCGYGIKIGVRYCDSPPPRNGGATCEGNNQGIMWRSTSCAGKRGPALIMLCFFFHRLHSQRLLAITTNVNTIIAVHTCLLEKNEVENGNRYYTHPYYRSRLKLTSSYMTLVGRDGWLELVDGMDHM